MTKDQLLSWLAETFWLVWSQGPRMDKKPGESVLAMSPLGAIKEFRFGEDGTLAEIEGLS